MTGHRPPLDVDRLRDLLLADAREHRRQPLTCPGDIAVGQRDLPVLLGGTLVIIAIGVLGNVVQDLSYGVLDPRIDTSDR